MPLTPSPSGGRQGWGLLAHDWRLMCTYAAGPHPSLPPEGIGIYTACQARKRVTAAAPLSITGWCMHTSFLIARYADWAPVFTPSPSGGGLGWGPAALASSASVPSASRPPSQPSPRGGRGKTPHQISVRRYQNCYVDTYAQRGKEQNPQHEQAQAAIVLIANLHPHRRGCARLAWRGRGWRRPAPAGLRGCFRR